jgi:hypothetical protein
MRVFSSAGYFDVRISRPCSLSDGRRQRPELSWMKEDTRMTEVYIALKVVYLVLLIGLAVRKLIRR